MGSIKTMITIRTFTPDDAEGVAAVILPIQQAEFEIPITLEAQPDLLNIPSFYQKHSGNFWVAEDADQIVGTIGLLDMGQRQAALRKMFVASAHRGSQHGVSGKLLEQLLTWSSANGIAEIFLGTTDKFLAAHRFYEKNGFEEIDKITLPLSFPIMAVDTKFYRLKLQKNADQLFQRPLDANA